jgi:hypothetical protein
LLECADEFSGLVGGDSAAYSDDYARCFSVHQTPSPPVSNLQNLVDKGVALGDSLAC